ncbi:glutamine-hydrolyzing carbamoyl-phosphate synthase small subunit [Parachitinimonas caeni]|uniref:glutamine-hydrolyzing carbamoyl-phosphate synthase small subunit n=1 Tax=Parachitinimonas caeni TaxID=3031301 RepID=UPI0027E58EEE|nr:glutamine-hydrolyzing carbamoyl-phosphate synthase small subunit [Parachitinimonas caeni]
MPHQSKALLALADGTLFHGTSIGGDGVAIGEVVFNTAMTGYQEILTDPSYTKQLVTLTYPHIGNVGVNAEDAEASRVYAAGLIVRDTPIRASCWRLQQTLPQYLREHGVVAIADVDTRKLTRILRERGAQSGAIVTGDAVARPDEAIALAKSFGSMAGQDLAKVVSAKEPYVWTDGEWRLGQGFAVADSPKFHVVAYDFGVKLNILRMLAQRGCKVTVVPAQTSAEEVMKLAPDGVFLSNGPGDPEPCEYAIAAIRVFLEQSLPIFGICLGHQLLGLAAGGKTSKMKFGHHGANHPVQDLDSGKVMITSQNHGFQVDESSLPANVRVTHRSLFDRTVQGIALMDKPAFSFQGHPEASPGPHDVAYLFDRFIYSMEAMKK